MAKKYVRAVARSNLDLESRKNVRQKEAELAVRRKAAFIGKEVCPIPSPVLHDNCVAQHLCSLTHVWCLSTVLDSP